MTKRGTRYSAYLMTSVALMATPAHAQGAAADAGTNADSDIIVTATKREQTLQDVPVAVTVTDAATIQRANITDIRDLQSVVPSLRVETRQNSVATNFFIRGFGNGANAAGIEPSVGVFIDGVYRSRSGAAISDLNNIQRIEVLRGPQSTLFGKNASAGVISIVTREPEFEWSGKVEATLGNYDQRRLRGFLNVPISDDKAAFSVSLNRNLRDGYFKNNFNGQTVNNIDRWSIAGDLLILPSDNMKIRIKGDYDRIDEDCCVVGELQAGLGNILVPAFGGDPVNLDPYAYSVSQDITPTQEVTNKGVSAQVDIDFDSIKLTSITSYRQNHGITSVDVDFSSAAFFGVSPTDATYKTFTQELRLTSDNDGPFNWLIGGFYFHETIDIDARVIWGATGRPYFQAVINAALGPAGVSPTALDDAEAALGLAPGTFFAPGTGSFEQFAHRDDSISAFTQLDYELTDNLTLTGGLNFTSDKKKVELSSRLTPDAFSNANFSGLPGTLPLLAALQFIPALVPLPNANEANTSSNQDLAWSIRASWKPFPQLNLYAIAATGFKAASWTLSRDSRVGSRFAKPEDTMLFEIGAKARFDNLSINLALFDQTIKNFQSTVSTGRGFAFLNADKQSSRGFELETNWQPVRGLSLVNSATYLDALYDSFPNFMAGIDLSGKRPAGIPKWSVTSAATYDFTIGQWRAFVRGDYHYESKTRLQDNTGALARTINEFNASMGVDFDNGLQLQMWARNLTNDKYYVGATPVSAQFGRIAGFPSMPRTYGATATFNF